jgi:putative tryptophan/tyrosine transport system substrate-binding protein
MFTGLTTQAVDLVGKRVELLREVVPDLRRLAILVNVAFPQAVLEMRRVKATALTLGIEVITPLEIQRQRMSWLPSRRSMAKQTPFTSWQNR